MGARLSVLGLSMSFSPYLRSAMVQFPLMSDKGVCRTAPATPGLLIIGFDLNFMGFVFKIT